jgi:hypothetical protein
MKITRFLPLAVAVAMLLSGCSLGRSMHNSMVSGKNAPFYLGYDDPEVIRDQAQVATITSTTGLIVDGVTASARTMRSANTGFMKRGIAVVDMLPGEHKVKVIVDPTGQPISMEPITHNFEAGVIYNISLMTNRVFIEENPDPKVAAKIAENRRNAEFEDKRR